MKTAWRRGWLGMLAGALPLLTMDVFACSCLPYPDDPGLAVEQAWGQSDAVVSGEVTHQQPVSAAGASDSVEVTLTVARAWKGPRDRQLKIRTSASSASCGYAFETGAQYLVFASRAADGRGYSTGLCTLTRPLAEARALVRALDARTAAK